MWFVHLARLLRWEGRAERGWSHGRPRRRGFCLHIVIDLIWSVRAGGGGEGRREGSKGREGGGVEGKGKGEEGRRGRGGGKGGKG